MKKQITKIAMYDGWKPDGIWYIKRKRSMGYASLSELYATNLNELHRVALDVCGYLFLTDGGYDLGVNIGNALLWRPVRKRYTHLIKAVADGIDYLNTKKI
jgi:hypothetical protein